jgi:hypothetical protein
MEGVRRGAAMRRRVGEQIDDLQLLDDRARPSMADDQRQRVLVLRANVDEMDVQPVDLGDEVGHRVELGLALAPVVLGLPVARDRLDRRQLHALRRIVDALLLGPTRGRDAGAQVLEVRLGDVDCERPDLCRVRSPFGHNRHVRLLGLISGVAPWARIRRTANPQQPWS